MIFKSVALLMFLFFSSRCDDADDDACVEGLSLRQKRAFEVRRSDDVQTIEPLPGKHLPGIEECDALELNRTLSAIQVRRWDMVKNSACRDHDAVLALQDGNLDTEDLFEIVSKYEQGSCKDKLLLPKVLIIGENRGGTSAIANLMHSHPNMSYGTVKEHMFFFPSEVDSVLKNAPGGPSRPEVFVERISNKTLAKYTTEFQVSCNINMTFDGSPQYWLLGHKGLGYLKQWIAVGELGSNAIQNIRTVLGDDVKIIMTLKDPVLWMNSNGVFTNLTRYKYAEEMMCVADSLDTWLEVIPRDNFLFLDFATMFDDLQGTMDSILKFIGMPTYDYSHIFATTPTGRRRAPRYYTEEFRKNYHADLKHKACQDRLSKQTGLIFNW